MKGNMKINKNKRKTRKVLNVKLLGADDPIWTLIGQGSSGTKDVSRRHDHYLANGERKRWRG